jgi:molybdopterin/thiamine biosynthesis adenylyltransferase
METTVDIVRRYRKQIAVPGIGIEGQRKLRNASALVIGAGGLGSPALLYLAAAGIGRIGIVDNDTVDLSNLQRQILYDEADQGALKAVRAAEKLHALNSTLTIEPFPVRLNEQNAAEHIAPYDVILDCADNFHTRYIISDECSRSKKMLVHASIHRFEGQVMGLCGDTAPCYRCLYPEQPADGLILRCDEAGVIGVLPGIIGSMQAAEALKHVLGAGIPLAGTLIVFDALTMQMRRFTIAKRADCRCCGT